MTDYGIHRLFTVNHESIDIFWVPTQKLKEEMVNLGINEKKIVVTGIPVENKFLIDKNVDRKVYCEKWKLPINSSIFLFVCGGGNGYDNALKYFSSLLELKYDFSYIFVAGKNERLYKKAKMIGDASSKFGVTLGYVDNMEDLLSISALVFGKPGGLMTSEALSMHIPFIALNPIPGQETLNGKFIVDNDFGFLVNNKEDFNQFLDKISKDKKNIQKWNKNIDANFKHFKFPSIKDI